MNFTTSKIMAVLNLTPDSFSDGGQLDTIEKQKKRLHELIDTGADIIDVGGESTRPGSVPVSAEEELRRISEIVEYIRREELYRDTVFSVDTYKSEVAAYALDAGFRIVNDVTALRADSILGRLIAEHSAYVVLMYARNISPHAQQIETRYVDVIKSIADFLRARIEYALKIGIPRERIIVDPGMGAFVSSDKAYSHEIIERLDELVGLGFPILVGPSRKLTRSDEESWRLAKKVIENGGNIVRMHSVKKFS